MYKSVAHIGQASNNSHLFWYNDIWGKAMFDYIWTRIPCYRDENQLSVLPGGEEKAKAAFAEFGYDIQF